MNTVLTPCVELSVSALPSHVAPTPPGRCYSPSYPTFFFLYHGATAPSGPRRPHWPRFTITLIHTTLGRTSLDEWPSRRRDLWQHATLNRQTSMLPAGFEPTIPTSERPQTHALDRAAAAFGIPLFKVPNFSLLGSLGTLATYTQRLRLGHDMPNLHCILCPLKLNIISAINVCFNIYFISAVLYWI